MPCVLEIPISWRRPGAYPNRNVVNISIRMKSSPNNVNNIENIKYFLTSFHIIERECAYQYLKVTLYIFIRRIFKSVGNKRQKISSWISIMKSVHKFLVYSRRLIVFIDGSILGSSESLVIKEITSSLGNHFANFQEKNLRTTILFDTLIRL